MLQQKSHTAVAQRAIAIEENEKLGWLVVHVVVAPEGRVLPLWKVVSTKEVRIKLRPAMQSRAWLQGDCERGFVGDEVVRSDS